MRRPLGLYLHIPFCRRKCAYCDFYSVPAEDARMDAFRDVMRARILAAGHAAAGAYQVDSVYFGGGTPSCLGAARLIPLLEAVAAAFPSASGPEVTLEANPESARDADALAALRGAGFNRLSLGMQAAGDGELRALGRVHTARQTEEAVECARRAGFTNLSLDLLYGLPDQTPAHWRGSLDAALALGPEHLSCYGLKLEPGTPLHGSPAAARVPDDDAQADAYLEAVERLAAHGYALYEISNFAKPGYASRHNLKYWTLGEYLGLGPGAHSDLGGRRFAYARDLDAWLADDPAPLSEDAVPSARERAAEYVMLGLRTARGVRAAEYPGDFAPAEAALRECVRRGLARERDGAFSLTPRGFLVSNAVILRVLEALEG